MSQGKSEHWQQALKNRIPVENHFISGDLEAQTKTFIVTSISAAATRHRRFPRPIFYLGPCPARLNDRLSPRVVCSTSCAPPDFINLRSRTLL